MNSTDIEPGDFVIDHTDNDNLREVDRIEDTTVFMKDGGFMGIDEIKDFLLPSQVHRHIK